MIKRLSTCMCMGDIIMHILMHVCMEVHVSNYGLEFNIYVQRVDTSASM